MDDSVEFHLQQRWLSDFHDGVKGVLITQKWMALSLCQLEWGLWLCLRRLKIGGELRNGVGTLTP